MIRRTLRMGILACLRLRRRGQRHPRPSRPPARGGAGDEPRRGGWRAHPRRWGAAPARPAGCRHPRRGRRHPRDPAEDRCGERDHAGEPRAHARGRVRSRDRRRTVDRSRLAVAGLARHPDPAVLRQACCGPAARSPARLPAPGGDLGALRGRLDVIRQCTVLAASPQRLACRYEDLDPDIALNRVLKATLTHLVGLARASETRRRLGELLFVYDEVAIRRARLAPALPERDRAGSHQRVLA